MVLGYQLPITGDVNLTEIFWIVSIQNFHCQELLEMGDGGQGGASDELSLHVLQLFRVSTLQHQINLGICTDK